MTKKERNQMDMIYGSDIYRIVKKNLKDNGYDVSIDCIKTMFEVYGDLAYTCMVNGKRILLPNIGELYRDIKKGRREGYYRVPSCKEDHTQISKNVVWHEEWKPQLPNWGCIKLSVFPRVKKKFREETTGNC